MRIIRVARWVAAAALAFALGWLAVGYLTVHPLEMSRYLLATTVAGCVLLVLVGTSFRRLELLGVLGLVIVALVGGWWMHTASVLGRTDSRPLPKLTRQASDPGAGHVAVVYLTHGEPRTFDPIGWLNIFREFDKDDVPFVPYLVRPMFIYALREAYLRVGSSPHDEIHMRTARNLQQSLRSEGYSGIRVYPSFLDSAPRPDAALIQALNDRASKVVVLEVLTTKSSHTEEGEALIRSVDTTALGVPVTFAGPLWDSATLHRMFLEKAEQGRGSTPRSKVGILLVGHGQPAEWDKLFPTQTSQELAFRERIMDLLAENGYDRRKMSMAWMEFKEPGVTEQTGQLAASGVDKILFFSAAISAESIHSTYDVPELVQEANVDANVERVNMGAWNDHPLVLQAIRERIEDALGAPQPR